MTNHITHFSDHIGVSASKFYKTTLFSGGYMMIGLNCLEPGQIQPVHDHSDQDKFYAVLEGEGLFTVGDEQQPAGPGNVVWAPAGLPHGVRNAAQQRLVLLVGMAPPPQR